MGYYSEIKKLIELKGKIDERISLLQAADKSGYFILNKNTDNWIILKAGFCATQYVGSLDGLTIDWPTPYYDILASADGQSGSIEINEYDFDLLESLMPGELPIYIGGGFVSSEFEELVKSV